MSQPLLSIGMIVKNEERCLEKCLKALEPLRQAIPCELVIADTGSTDKTKEIASKYANILFDFEWINDFSAARNAVMDRCSGKWYLTVDADEYLNSAIDELADFLNNNSNPNINFATIIQRNYSGSSMKGAFSDFNAVRLARIDKKPRYEGTIHESFFITDINEIHILENTVFDHDGYTSVTPDHLKKKEERNLKLLEEKLKNEPDNIRCILLCLESSSLFPEKKRYYTEYAFKILKENVNNELFYKEIFGPACISTAIGYAIEEHHAFTEENIIWALNTFPESPHTLIDVNFYYAKFLYKRNEYKLCVEICNKYLNALNNHNNSVASHTMLLSTPVKCTKNTHKSEILVYAIASFIKLNETAEALNLISKLDLSEAGIDTFECFFNTIASPDTTEEISISAGNVVTTFFETWHKEHSYSNETYNAAISTLMNIFSCTKVAGSNYSNFTFSDCSIGLSAKIADAKTKEEAEQYLFKLEHCEELMPVALKNAISLNAELPKNFFLTSNFHLNNLIADLIEEPGNIFINLKDNYFDAIENKEWYEISFYYNLLFSILLSNSHKFTSEQKIILSYYFYRISEIYLNTCYDTDFISDENNISCLPPTQLFSYYFVKAMEAKSDNSLEYIRLLRIALKKLPQAKQIIELLIEDYKNEEEKRKQENLKQTTPELIAMAEQLKAMLSAFPKNSPELLAIKQSPLYKQVAFLIED